MAKRLGLRASEVVFGLMMLAAGLVRLIGCLTEIGGV